MKVLILDSTFACKGIYDSLIAMGHSVYTIGYRKDDFLACNNSNRHFFCDYSDHELVKKIINDNEINAIIPGCTDTSLNTFQKLHSICEDETLNEIIELCLNKKELYKFFKESGVKCPPEYCSDNGKHMVIVKPVDSYSGRGITVVDPKNKSALNKAQKYAESHSDTGETTSNIYIDGQLISFSVVMCENHFNFISCVNEYCTQSKFKVDASYCVTPDVFVNDKRLVEDLNKIRSSIKIKRPVFLHFQCIKTDTETYFIEMMMRHPGDLYSSLVQQSTGVPYSDLYVATFIDEQNHDIYSVDLQNIKPIVRLTLSCNDSFNAIQLDTKNVERVEVIPLKNLGDSLESSSRVGIAFMHIEKKSCLDTYIEVLVNG